MINRAFYSETIGGFLDQSDDVVMGRLALASPFADDPNQKAAWKEQFRILRAALAPYRADGKLYLEFDVPRMGMRIDAVAVIRNVVFVLEFKVGETHFATHDIDQACDYALDLKNFHETSHAATVAPILVATKAHSLPFEIGTTARDDGLLIPVCACEANLGDAISAILMWVEGPAINAVAWEAGRYSPTPTIIDAAMALYANHRVEELSRSDAGATNLTRTSSAVSSIIRAAEAGSHKTIVFVTGVPGAGKTLVGLNTATQHSGKSDKLHSVFLSGNGPLVAILREALARDKVRREAEAGRKERLTRVREEVKAFIQNVHHFRDEYARHDQRAPIDHVVIFDEAQRAWDLAQTAAFMKRKRGLPAFANSEPEFLVSCMNRHSDWAVVVCLVGGGQEINTGEAGITEWIESILRSFAGWHVYISPHLKDSEYGAGTVLARLEGRPNVHFDKDLHLAVSMRSFRAEHVSGFVKALLDQEEDEAQRLLAEFQSRYPLVLTRDISEAKG